MATAKKTVKKAQRGVSIGTYMTMNPKTNQLNRLDKFKHSDGDRYYRSSGPRDFEQTIADENMMKSYGNSADSIRSSTLTAAERKAIDQKKNGGKVTKSKTVKAKDGKWIQKAVNPKHKGYCTPMTKATCTPKRKALAKTFKAMGRARKGK